VNHNKVCHFLAARIVYELIQPPSGDGFKRLRHYYLSRRL
jgi:hypothetical protein